MRRYAGPALLAVVVIVAVGLLAPTALAIAGDGAATNASSVQLDSNETADRSVAVNGNGTVELIVKVDDVTLPFQSNEAGVDARKTAAAEAQEPVLEYIEETDGIEAQNQFWLVNAVLVEVDTTEFDPGRLTEQDGVSEVHENFQYNAPEPADTGGADLEGDSTYGLEQIRAQQVWDEHGTQGAGAKVAVLDTGIDVSHPDLELTTDDPGNSTYPGGWAEFDDSGDQVDDSTPYDSSDHGTHVSGTVAGGDASGTAIGVAPDAELMHGLVLQGGTGSFAQIIGGMEWAVEEDADVISMSLGGEGYHGSMIEVVQNAEEAGTLVVTSSGNAGPETSSSPGNIYDSFAVGATDETEEVTYFSSGETVFTDSAWGDAALSHWPTQYVVPDVAAPGGEVMSAVPGGGYGAKSGTSMAAPHVSGAAALMISASGGELEPAEIRGSLETWAHKPDEIDTEQDTRYGHGLIDAMNATTEVAAQQGVEGTVTDTNGDPISDATVALDAGASTTTDDVGEYLVRTLTGTYNVSVSEFGYASDETELTVTEGAFTQHDVSLDAILEGRVAAPQTAQVEAGNAVTVTLDVAHADNITVTQTRTESGDTYDGNATLYVDGAEAAFGEPIDLDAGVNSVDVTVETEAGTNGGFALDHTLTGSDGEKTITTGPTAVVADPIFVGIVDDGQSEHASALTEAMNAELGDEYFLSTVSSAEAVDQVGSHDVFVVHQVDDEADVEALVDATAAPDTGVVYLDQWGETSNGVSALSDATRNPVTTGQSTESPPPQYDVVEEHPIVDGVANVSESFELHGHPRGDVAWFSGYEGTTITMASDSSGERGVGLAVDESTQTVLASTLGRSPSVRNSYVSNESDELLGNAIEYANDLPPAWYAGEQPAHIEPGESFDLELEADDLTGFNVSLRDSSSVHADNLTLSIDGDETAFDEWQEVNSSTETVTVTVNTSADTIGSVRLATTVENEAGDQAELLSGPTAVYEAPLVVPEDVESVQEAVDLAPAGATVEVAAGEYEERVRITTPDLTLTSHGDERPLFENIIEDYANDHLAPGIHVDAPGVTVESLAVEINVTAPDFLPAQGVGVEVDQPNAHVEDVAVDGAQEGILIGGDGSDASGSTVTDVSATNGPEFFARGVAVTEADNVTVTQADVDTVTVGVDVVQSTGTVVRNNTMTDLRPGPNADSAGIASADIDGVRFVNNDISDSQQGIRLEMFVRPELVAHNDISNASEGVYVEGANAGGPIRHNTINAEYGVWVERGDGPATEVEFNDLSAASVAIVNNLDESLNARRNYLGERNASESIVEGDVVYEPFLTAPPSEVDTEDPRQLGVDLTFEAGDTYGVALPGSTDQTVSELFGSDLEGVVYGFDATEQAWHSLSGDDRVDALEGIAVVADSNGTMTISHYDGSDEPATPGQVETEEGWNFVGVPQYGSFDDAYDHGTMAPSLAMDPFEAPGSQLASPGGFDGTYYFDNEPSDVAVSPYEGYFVFVEDAGVVPAHVPPNPSVMELLEGTNTLAAE